jgi:hypothetical protein
MRTYAYVILLLITVFSACKKKDGVSKGDFNGHRWGAEYDKIVEAEKPKEGSAFEMDGVTELLYEDTFLGVKTDFELEDIARLNYMFVDNKLVGGWFYVFANYELFNPAQYISIIENEAGKPIQTWADESGIDLRIWKTSRSVIRVLVQDLGDKNRFEWYAYELSWYNQNKDRLGLPELQ